MFNKKLANRTCIRRTGKLSAGCSNRLNQNSGLALLLVLFIVALASIIVINLTYSTYLGSRISITAERSVQAEYLLKSALNFARALIKADQTDEDSYRDDWGKFANGLTIPPDLLGIDTPDFANIKIDLEIRTEGSKMNLKNLVPGSQDGQASAKWRDVLTRLFIALGFDNDADAESGVNSGGTAYKSHDMVANLIDYIDPDQEPYNIDDFKGIENENSGFSNSQITRMGELAAVPGFTAARIQKMTPFLSTKDKLQININLASRLLIKSLHEDLTDGEVDRIIEYRNSEEGPFKSAGQVRDFIQDEQVYNEISSLITERSGWFQVLAKVDYGTSTYFMRAYISKTTLGQLPNIQSIEIF